MYFASRPTDSFDADAYWQVGAIASLIGTWQKKKTEYFQIPLMNKEFSYDVDVSNVGCHCNAAAYFIDMPGLSSTQYHHILRDIL